MDDDPPVAAPPPVTSTTDTDTVPATSTGDWTVQLGAFSTLERAQDLAERVRAAGFEPRLVRVPPSDLVRLRVGVFEDDDSAADVYYRIVQAGFDAAIARDVTREEPIG